MTNSSFSKSYASFGIHRSLLQVRHALNERKKANENMRSLFEMLRRQEQHIQVVLGKPVENLQILEIGPGQGLERARYLGLKNHVVALDRDIIPTSSDPAVYIQMAKENGLGRLMKTLGRKLIIGGANETAWARWIESEEFCDPSFLHGDICEDTLPTGAYDLIVSWSVFEHLPQPRKALENVIQALRPQGGFFISLHLWTSINGSHDIRAFTGQVESLPLWGHLRPTISHQIVPSSYLNRWRIAQWRELFYDLSPGVEEKLEVYDYKEKYSPRMTQSLRDELRDYTDEELFSVDATYLWQKPAHE